MSFFLKKYKISSSSGNFTTSNTSYTAVTNLSLSFTTDGKHPVFIGLINDASGNPSTIGPNNATFADPSCTLKFLRGATNIGEHTVRGLFGAEVVNRIHQCGNMFVIEVPAAGTYTYSVEVKVADAAHTATVNYVKLVVLTL